MMPAASIATRMPSHGFPVELATLNALIAPINIMPSTPRFKTPERSANNSPIAANNNTVPLATPAWRIVMKSIALFLSTHDANAIPQQIIAGDQTDQDNALDHLRHT